MNNFEVNQQDLDIIERELNEIEGALQKAHLRYVKELRDEWRRRIPRDTGAYAASLNYVPISDSHPSAQEFWIQETSGEVNYSLISEAGRTDEKYHHTPAAWLAVEHLHDAETLWHLSTDELNKVLLHAY